MKAGEPSVAITNKIIFQQHLHHGAGVKDLMFAGRNWCLWTAHGNSHSTLVHPLDIKISGPLASHSSNNTLGWLPLDCGPCYLHQCCFLILHRRSMFVFFFFFSFFPLCFVYINCSSYACPLLLLTLHYFFVLAPFVSIGWCSDRGTISNVSPWWALRSSSQ